MSKPDSLADAFAELPKPSQRCSLGVILATASDVARERIERALAADRQVVKNQWIIDRLRDAGHAVSKDTVSQHRRNVCRCVR